jgi:hypothetical protein
MRIWFLARPHVLSAAWVKENCFSLSFITDPCWQTWRRVSTGSFFRVSGGVRPPQGRWRVVATLAATWVEIAEPRRRLGPGPREKSPPLRKARPAGLPKHGKRGQTVDCNSSCAHGSSACAGLCWCCPRPERWSTDLAPSAVPI